MQLNRRQFVVLSAISCAGCAAGGGVGHTGRIRTVDAGPAAQFASDGVYDQFRGDGFFLVREGPELFAVSSTCTHRECRLRAEPDHTFYCKCHGSRFTEEGKVTKGPATRDLPHFPVTINDQQRVLVEVMD